MNGRATTRNPRIGLVLLLELGYVVAGALAWLLAWAFHSGLASSVVAAVAVFVLLNAAAVFVTIRRR